MRSMVTRTSRIVMSELSEVIGRSLLHRALCKGTSGRTRPVRMMPTAGSGLIGKPYYRRIRASRAIVQLSQLRRGRFPRRYLPGALFGDLEYQAGRGGVRQQATGGVGDVGLGCGRAAADIEGTAFAANLAGVLGHALDEADL